MGVGLSFCCGLARGAIYDRFVLPFAEEVGTAVRCCI